MTDIIRVWGTCDNLQIEFSYKGGNTWTCVVPPDFKDGVYVAEFWALDTKERIGHWTGFLYMSSGICHFKIQEQKNRLWIETKSQYDLHFQEKKQYQTSFNLNNWTFETFTEEYKPLKIFFQPTNYKLDFNNSSEKKYILNFEENKYNFEFFEAKKEFDRDVTVSPRINLQTRLMLKKKAKEIANQYSAILGKAILGLMILGSKETEKLFNLPKYQIRFNTNNYKINITDFNYKIFIEERCKHWEP